MSGGDGRSFLSLLRMLISSCCFCRAATEFISMTSLFLDAGGPFKAAIDRTVISAPTDQIASLSLS